MSTKYSICPKFNCDKTCLHKELHTERDDCSTSCNTHGMSCASVPDKNAKRLIRLDKKIITLEAIASSNATDDQKRRYKKLCGKRKALRKYICLES